MEGLSLYLHIPFCLKKCIYCDFTSFPHKEALFEAYTKALTEEIKIYGKKFNRPKVNTIFFGGGTPTILPVQKIREIVEAIYSCFDVDKGTEMSIETNPDTVALADFRAFKEMGFNRVSIGLQSGEDDLLRFLGRTHTWEGFVRAYRLVREAGFDNVNIDLIFAIPGQTTKMWLDTLQKVTALAPEHLSLYSLTIEEKTVLGKWVERKKVEPVSDETDRKMYHTAICYLKEKGYIQYEISNFAKEGLACRHNLVYWERGDYLGLGVSSHSMLEDKRFFNTSDLTRYIESLEQGLPPVEGEEKLTEEEIRFEKIMLGLRLKKGVPKEWLKGKEEATERLLRQNLLEEKGAFLCLTTKGMDLSNEVFLEFME